MCVVVFLFAFFGISPQQRLLHKLLFLSQMLITNCEVVLRHLRTKESLVCFETDCGGIQCHDEICISCLAAALKN